MTRRRFVAGLLCAIAAAAVLAAPVLKAGSEPLNYVDINKIKGEGLQRLAGHGPGELADRRVRPAADRVAHVAEGGRMDRREDEGMRAGQREDRALGRTATGSRAAGPTTSSIWPPWRPRAFPIPGTPTAWTPGTDGLVSGEVVLVTETTAGRPGGTTQGKLQGQVGADAGRRPTWRRTGRRPATRYTKESNSTATRGLSRRPQPGVRRAAPGGRAGAAWRARRAGAPPAGRPRRHGLDGRAQRLLQGRGRARHVHRPRRAATASTRSAATARPIRPRTLPAIAIARRAVRPHRPHAREEHPGHHRGRHQEHVHTPTRRCSTSSARSPAPTRPTKS